MATDFNTVNNKNPVYKIENFNYFNVAFYLVLKRAWRNPLNFLCTIYQIGPVLIGKWSLLMTSEGQQFSLPLP